MTVVAMDPRRRSGDAPATCMHTWGDDLHGPPGMADCVYCGARRLPTGVVISNLADVQLHTVTVGSVRACDRHAVATAAVADVVVRWRTMVQRLTWLTALGIVVLAGMGQYAAAATLGVVSLGGVLLARAGEQVVSAVAEAQDAVAVEQRRLGFIMSTITHGAA